MTSPTALPEQNFVHRSVLAKEAPEYTVTRPDGVYVDATFGRGGHSRSILEKLSEKGRLIAFDRDPQAVAAATAIEDPRFMIIHSAFSNMCVELEKLGLTRIDGVLMDIGVSSPQIDDASRGFSFRMDGPLDMRMDTTCGMTAAEWVASAAETEIEKVIRIYGEERFSRQIARAIVQARETTAITRTGELADLIARTIPRAKHDPKQHPATRSFQAIRIHINGELDELTDAMRQAGRLLNAGGHLAIISFHSLEDRLVKHFFEAGAHPERRIDTRIALRAQDMPQPWWADVRRIKPSREECEDNARARSAVMRVGVRTERVWGEDAEGVL